MQYCKHCKVFVSSKTDFCPLCHKSLVGDKKQAVETFPKYEKPLKYKRNIAQLIINILAPIGILTTVLINLLTYNGVLWSIIDTMAIIYLWAFGVWTFKRDGNIGKKIVYNAIAINIILVTINIFGFNLATLPNTFWSLTYALPFIVSAVLLANNIIMFTKKYSIKDFVMSQFSLSFLGIGCFVLAFCGVTSAIYPAFIALSITILTLLLFALFGKKILKQEFARYFHI